MVYDLKMNDIFYRLKIVPILAAGGMPQDLGHVLWTKRKSRLPGGQVSYL